MVLTAALAVASVMIGLGFGTAGAQTNVVPVAAPGGPYSGVAGVPVQFNAGSSTGLGLSFEWSFGDGTSATGAAVSHTYATAGTYAVTLTVRDVFGQAATATTTATVSAAGSAPYCVQTASGLYCVTSAGATAAPSCVQTTAGLMCGIWGSQSSVSCVTAAGGVQYINVGSYWYAVNPLSSACAAGASWQQFQPFVGPLDCSVPNANPYCRLLDGP
jgi:PKD repeat protein